MTDYAPPPEGVTTPPTRSCPGCGEPAQQAALMASGAQNVATYRCAAEHTFTVW